MWIYIYKSIGNVTQMNMTCEMSCRKIREGVTHVCDFCHNHKAAKTQKTDFFKTFILVCMWLLWQRQSGYSWKLKMDLYSTHWNKDLQFIQKFTFWKSHLRGTRAKRDTWTKLGTLAKQDMQAKRGMRVKQGVRAKRDTWTKWSRRAKWNVRAKRDTRSRN